jgi:predicted secreted acid phosphatase
VNGAHNNNVDALVWLDTSAEQSALYRQAFCLARLRVEAATKAEGRPLQSRYCVFTDCDETILDNSEYNAWLALTGRNFHTRTWDEYCKAQRSKACAGSVPFAIWLVENGIELFYVTSRSNATRSATVSNLSMLGFPVTPSDAEDDPALTHLFMAGMPHPDGSGEPWSKWEQHEWIAKNRLVEPLVWLGDNLSDFRACYKSQRWDERLQSADQEDRENWGTRYIVMPNPVYGDWMRNYLSRRNGDLLVDDTASYVSTPLPVRTPAIPAQIPKISELEIWPEWR